MSEQSQIIKIEPDSFIHFVGPFRVPVTSRIKLTNLLDKRVCFKVKNSAPTCYAVSPGRGVIEPNQVIDIIIILRPFNYDPYKLPNHSFLIQTMILQEGEVNTENLWRDADPGSIRLNLLLCVFSLPLKSIQRIDYIKGRLRQLNHFRSYCPSLSVDNIIQQTIEAFQIELQTLETPEKLEKDLNEDVENFIQCLIKVKNCKDEAEMYDLIPEKNKNKKLVYDKLNLIDERKEKIIQLIKDIRSISSPCFDHVLKVKSSKFEEYALEYNDIKVARKDAYAQTNEKHKVFMKAVKTFQKQFYLNTLEDNKEEDSLRTDDESKDISHSIEIDCALKALDEAIDKEINALASTPHDLEDKTFITCLLDDLHIHKKKLESLYNTSEERISETGFFNREIPNTDSSDVQEEILRSNNSQQKCEEQELEEPSSNDIEMRDDFPVITPEMETVIAEVFEPGDLKEELSVIADQTLTREAFLTLSGIKWLNDQVINCYLALIAERSKLGDYPSVYAFNSFFYQALEKSGPNKVLRWTRRIDIFEYDIILVPVNVQTVHWALLCIDNRNNEISYYDSIGRTYDSCIEKIQSYLIAEHLDKKKTDLDPNTYSVLIPEVIPVQENGSDCGVFLLKYAEYWTRNAPITFTQKDMPYFRKIMVYELMTKKIMS